MKDKVEKLTRTEVVGNLQLKERVCWGHYQSYTDRSHIVSIHTRIRARLWGRNAQE